MSLSQYLSEIPTLGLFANSEPRSLGHPELALSLPKGPGRRALLGRAGEGTRLCVYRSLALATLLLLTLSFAQRSAAQITVSPDHVNGVHTEGDTHLLPGGPYCSLQEAIYATEFGAGVALDYTDQDHT
jgi:hypothetical protein